MFNRPKNVLLALSIASLCATCHAGAQTIVCSTVTAIPNGPGAVALESAAALLPTLQVTCTPPAQPPAGAVTIWLTANVPWANFYLQTADTFQGVTATDSSGDVASSITLIGPTVIQIVFASVSGRPSSFSANGLRVIANFAAPSSVITVAASGVGGGIFEDLSPANPVAYVMKSLAPPTINAAVVPNTSACTLGAGTSATVYPVANVAVTEGFPSAFQNAGGSMGQNLSATLLAVTFNNLNQGVNYYVPGTITGSGTITLVAYADGTGTSPAPTVGAPVPGAVLLTAINGSVTVYYGVSGADPTIAESFAISLVGSVSNLSAVTSYTTLPVSVSITVQGPLAGSEPVYASPPYVATQTVFAGQGNGLLTPCSTTLLFPYVTNTGGFDGGIALINASIGTGAAGLAPSSGLCSVTFYGLSSPSINPYVTDVVTPGSVATFAIGEVAPGFSGYLVATCSFAGAEGYAFMSYLLGSGNGVAVSYLAKVVGNADTNLGQPR